MAGSWRVRGGAIPLDRPLVMGVVNTTPDSFSDGGDLPTVAAAVEHGLSLAAAGADIVDVGGESTRPGADPVAAAVEIERTVPVVGQLAAAGLVVSVDTRKPEVARAAVDAGAVIVNDIGGMRDPAMRRVAGEQQTGVVVMHMLGTPKTMQDDPSYAEVVTEVAAFLRASCGQVEADGVDPRSIVIDPGIGFGKTAAHNLRLLNRLEDLAELGYPVLVGASRKRFLGDITGRAEARERDFASAVASAAAVLRGACIVRVHDPAPTLEAVKVAWAIVREGGAPWGPVVREGVAEG